ncbi:probable mediator of RNA polymerase II transcription subunit 26b [Vitis vinifera]|nr:probable mediator of RNA polymerase II transcription subunit 26b [Vitis vinifera]|eukprot:XP_019077119.1 PREDICTED: probable mediator of RNA polymerase II transcription subunit 26b isoform X2 [Vitis vinifera]
MIMSMESEGLDHWRSYFKSASSSIFEVIEHGIMVAAKDCPEEFRLKRGKIAEKLYSCQFAGNSGCDCVEVSMKNEDLNVEKREGGGDEKEVGGNGDVSKADCGQKTKDDGNVPEHAVIQMRNRNDPKGKAMEDENHEVDEENEILGEVLRIKELITSSPNEVTMVGKAVNDLRKRSSKQTSQLAKTLIEGWQLVVDQWVSAMEAVSAVEAVSGSAADSNPCAVDEKELPSLPLNDQEFPSLPWNENELLFVPMREEDIFPTQTASEDCLETFFDGLDEDGNPISTEDDEGERMEQEPAVKPMEVPNINLSTTNLGPGRRLKPSLETKLNNETESQQKSDKFAITKRQGTSQYEILNGSNEAAVLGKPEAMEPELEEDRQQAENAKKPRTMRFMDFRDVPKQGLRRKSPRPRRRNQQSH